LTNRDLTRLVQSHLDKLEYIHPLVNTDKFVENSHAKWACKELLRFIEESEGLPFALGPQEVLEQFIDKMATYAYMNSRNSLPFSIAQQTAEYLKEQSYRIIYNTGKEKK